MVERVDRGSVTKAVGNGATMSSFYHFHVIMATALKDTQMWPLVLNRSVQILKLYQSCNFGCFDVIHIKITVLPSGIFQVFSSIAI